MLSRLGYGTPSAMSRYFLVAAVAFWHIGRSGIWRWLNEELEYPRSMSSAKNIIETFRDVVQDLLVPELKAVKVSVESLNHQIDGMRSDLKQSHESLREEMKLRHDSIERMIKYGDDRNEQLIRTLADKLDFAGDIRERLATIEARMPKQ